MGDLSLQADVTDEQSGRGHVRAHARQFGGIDVLFNNAGISPNDDASVLDTTFEAWERVQNVNLKASFPLLQVQTVDNGGGSVIRHRLVRGGGLRSFAISLHRVEVGGALAMSL